jgi:hypothetical protein
MSEYSTQNETRENESGLGQLAKQKERVKSAVIWEK